MEEVTMYCCSVCRKSFKNSYQALQCEFIHTRTNYANSLLEAGYSLASINYYCGFGWTLKKEQESITKDNCFVISYWQCCDKPAYKIVSVNDNGTLYLCGKGSWDGYFGNGLSIQRLPEPHPKEDLFVDPR